MEHNRKYLTEQFQATKGMLDRLGFKVVVGEFGTDQPAPEPPSMYVREDGIEVRYDPEKAKDPWILRKDGKDVIEYPMLLKPRGFRTPKVAMYWAELKWPFKTR